VKGKRAGGERGCAGRLIEEAKANGEEICFFLVLFLAVSSAYIQYPLLSSPAGADLKTIYGYSLALSQGKNIYERMGGQDLNNVGLYPCYMPLVYASGGFIALAGHGTLDDWAFYFRLLTLVLGVGIAFLIYFIAEDMGQPLIGLFGAAFWSFNRFGLVVLSEGHADTVTLFILLSSLYFFEKRPQLSCLLLGLAVSFKQFPAILAPVYIILLREKIGLLKAAVLVSAIPLLSAAPFLILNSTAFVKAMWWSFVRPSSQVSLVYSASPMLDIFGDWGWLSRLPIALMYVLLFVLVYAGRVGVYSAALLAFTIFLAYNTYIYPRYFSWMIPFLPLAVLELACRKRK